MTKNTTNSQNAESPSNRSAHRILVLAIVLLVITGLVWGVLYFFILRNHAQDAVQPFRDALARAGSTECRSYGDGGYGPDNRRPWYQTTYQVPLSKDKTFELVNKTATANGFHLEEATPQHRSDVLPTDYYLHDAYFDDFSQKSQYGDLKNGPIMLGIVLNLSTSDKETCGGKPMVIDANHTAVYIHMVFPDVNGK